MEYGHFDDARHEYVITRPDTPWPWINYLGSEEFFALVSNTAGGYCFCRDARLLRLTRYRYNNVPLDSGGFYFYVRSDEDVFCPGGMPVATGLDAYECRHGLGYTSITGEKNGLRVRQTHIVPRGENAMVTRVTVTNETDGAKNVDLYSFVEFCLWNAMDDATNFQRNFSTGEVEVDSGEIYHVTEYRERRNHYAVFGVNREIAGFDTDREAFLGRMGSFSMPEVVRENRSKDSVASGWAPIGSHHLKITVNPQQTQSVIFVLGFIENGQDEKFESPGAVNKEKARALLKRFKTDWQFDRAMRELSEYWTNLLNRFSVDTADAGTDRMINVWNQYQCMATFNLSRSASFFESGIGRGMGFRDSTQDLLGFVHMIPDRARSRILDIAATQFQDGSAYHQYQPLTKRGNSDVGTGFNDDPLWLIAGVAAYIKETGDRAILDESVPFDNDPKTIKSLFEHLRRSFRFTTGHLGPHGLPLIGRADWNDCLNLNCFSDKPGESFQTCQNFDSGRAESVFIAGMFVYIADDYASICEMAGDGGEADFARRAKADMERAVLESGWDGEWFLRAYDAYSGKVGSKECDEGKIFIEPQGFCVMAGIGVKTGHAKKALDSVRKHLMCDYGIAILTPPYTKYHLELGEISSYPPGYKENGGIFCHNNPWITLAEAKIGRGDYAFEVYRSTCPAYITDQSLHLTEPYVYSQMIAGPYAKRYGQAKNSWLTGTAAWSFYSFTQGILGIKPEFDGLRIDPCLPSSMKDVRVRRFWRENTYDIHIVNRAGGEKGLVGIALDGSGIDGNIIPDDKEKGRVIAVEVTVY